MEQRAIRITVTGIVQGVGFRPFIYRLAHRLSLSGYVKNSIDGVEILAQGSSGVLDDFVRAICNEAPAVSRIESLEQCPAEPLDTDVFSIEKSSGGSEGELWVTPDFSMCDHCLAEINDPSDRRFRYAFTTCTDCGPRYSVIHHTPYDREQTTMADFTMCEACRIEYETPENRRYHSQTNACPDCGPALFFHDRKGKRVALNEQALARALDYLDQGKILAVKGLGGFLLCCDAANEDTVKLLRERKRRPVKPFALMGRDLDAIRACCEVSEPARKTLECPERPIVLCPRKDTGQVAESVAPDNAYLGVMLPYTPLHIFLLDKLPLLIMTSGNLSGEPILADDKEAMAGLADVADGYLTNDRDIHNAIDDSVFRITGTIPVAVRRARGYVPGVHTETSLTKNILALGAELKVAFAMNRGPRVFTGPHIGDLKYVETLDRYTQSIERFQAMLGIRPEVIAGDLHPQFLSTQWAEDKYPGLPVIRVGHHHAHLVSAMAEAGMDGEVIGIAMDGAGYGDDGTIWGCECGVVSRKKFDRRVHLDCFQLPGGDACVAEIDRIAVSLLSQVREASEVLALVPGLTEDRLNILGEMLDKKINSPRTSSMGRLFDGVACLAGLGNYSWDEASAAIHLEAVCDTGEYPGYDVSLIEQDGRWIWDWRPMIDAVAGDVVNKAGSGVISARFHASVVTYIVKSAEILRRETGLGEVVLSGGVFVNGVVGLAAVEGLKDRGFNVWLQHRFPPGDGGIALGQLMIANEEIR
jgi:hydrogenase maturation protein HypF